MCNSIWSSCLDFSFFRIHIGRSSWEVARELLGKFGEFLASPGSLQKVWEWRGLTPSQQLATHLILTWASTYVEIWFWNLFQDYATSNITSDVGFDQSPRQASLLTLESYGISIQLRCDEMCWLLLWPFNYNSSLRQRSHLICSQLCNVTIDVARMHLPPRKVNFRCSV